MPEENQSPAIKNESEDRIWWPLIKKELDSLLHFSVRFVGYISIGTIIAGVLGYIIGQLIGEITEIKLASSLLQYALDPNNIDSLAFAFFVVSIAFGSASYIVVRYITAKESKNLSELNAQYKTISEGIPFIKETLSKHLMDINASVQLNRSCETLTVIGYSQLMQREEDSLGREIIIITNNLADDVSELDILPIIIRNLAQGKKYHFIVPSTTQNKRDGAALRQKVNNAMSERKFILLDSFIHFANDDMFKICAFRDIAIYGSGVNDKSLMEGYAELPTHMKTDEVSARGFMKIDKKVCQELVNDIDAMLNGTESQKYFLSIQLDSIS